MVQIKEKCCVRENKKWPILVMVALLVCCLATGMYSFLFIWQDDNTAPVITINGEELQVSVSAPEEELLQGVSAADNRDGDVTSGIVVEGVSNIGDDHTATVTYAAFDKSGNVAKAARTLIYTDYESPRFGLEEALVFRTGAAPDVLSLVTATDAIDGDLSEQVKGVLVSDTGSLSYAGHHQVSFRVTNSMGDTAYITLPVDVYNAEENNAGVKLTDYLIYLEKGAQFQPKDYLSSLVIGATAYPLKNLTRTESSGNELSIYECSYKSAAEEWKIYIKVEGAVDTSTPGTYSVAYTVTTNNYTGHTRLNVVVEE